jgi:pimeloyl-ACP methyl ester carboxylesterase
MRSLHFICAALVTLAVARPETASAQPPPAPPDGASGFTIFVRALPVGNEQIALTRSADGWSIVSSGRIGAPLDVIARRVQVRYTPDWRPRDMTIDATVRGQPHSIRTVVEGSSVKTEFTTSAQPGQKTDPIDPTAVLIVPSPFFSPYEALAQRLKTATVGAEIPIYNAPIGSFAVRVGESSAQQIQTTGRLIAAKRTRVTLMTPGAPVDADIWTDEPGRMIRLSIPAQSLEVVRDDVAAVSSRSVVISRANDQPAQIPSNGFSLVGTISRPTQEAAVKLPAVVLVGGSGPTDRDGMAYGIPILGEIAGALADAGFLVVRYDKRGIGQSGGRAESASLTDYAEDVIAAVKMLAARKDVDPKRIAVIGHSEGGSVAMIAGAKDKRIAAVGLLATPGVTGAEVVLAQQKHLLDRSTLSAEDKQAKIDQQKRIHQAVISGKGLDQLPPEVRRAVDNAEFQSILITDPSKLMPNLRKPLLIVQPELDTQVEPANADKLDVLAKQRKNAPPVETVKLPGVNHLLVPATTGEVEEYARLTERHVSPAVTQALVTWLKKIF